MIRTLPIAAEMLNLVSAGQPEPVMVWEDQNGRRVLTDRQEHDSETGEPIWTCYVMPMGTERPEVLQLRVPARQQPVLTQFGPVAVDNLTVNVRVDRAGKLAQYWSAAGIRDAAQPGKRNGHAEHKQPEGQSA
ncbi:hypothetical protein ACR9E3_13140 [Actinomycetospora sp. C-140]